MINLARDKGIIYELWVFVVKCENEYLLRHSCDCLNTFLYVLCENDTEITFITYIRTE